LGYDKAFSTKGIKIVVDYFLKRNHKDIKAFVPRFRRGTTGTNHVCRTLDPEILDKLEKDHILIYTPSNSYDDRYILETAVHYNAVIVSNDKYRDLFAESADYKRQAETGYDDFTLYLKKLGIIDRSFICIP
jgi:predicted nucleic acid-binding protein